MSKPEDSIAVWYMPGEDRPWWYQVLDTCGSVFASGSAATEDLARSLARASFDRMNDDDATLDVKRWTVVGVTEGQCQNRVEYVLATDAERAAVRACEGNTQLLVVAVFEGRIVDRLASEIAERWPLSEDEEEPVDDGRAA